MCIIWQTARLRTLLSSKIWDSFTIPKKYLYSFLIRNSAIASEDCQHKIITPKLFYYRLPITIFFLVTNEAIVICVKRDLMWPLALQAPSKMTTTPLEIFLSLIMGSQFINLFSHGDNIPKPPVGSPQLSHSACPAPSALLSCGDQNSGFHGSDGWVWVYF